VGAQLSFHYDRKQIILERSDVSENLGGQYVELYDFIDRPMEVSWKGVSLPYRVFSKDQRVSHTAIVENKRLGHALALIKAKQDLRQTTRVMTNSEKTGYRKRTRMVSATLPVLNEAPEFVTSVWPVTLPELRRPKFRPQCSVSATAIMRSLRTPEIRQFENGWRNRDYWYRAA
jgi:hypothetical protein